MIYLISDDVYKKLSKHPKRLFHVNSVALTAVSLAKIYQIDFKKTYIAAIMHDYAKYENDDFYNHYISEELINKYQTTKVLYHSIAAANYAKIHYNIDEDIYNAIYNHVFGRPNMSVLEKIIFVSDSIYFTGKDHTIHLYDIALKDLNQAVIEAIRLTADSLNKRGLNLHLEQIETMNYYMKE
ncbi:MAG TPA: HD domain-containing protein [Acholeplasmataceae bacterium]|nr:HD domain-containing protein [Acholeplasmataceae bacterium]